LDTTYLPPLVPLGSPLLGVEDPLVFQVNAYYPERFIIGKVHFRVEWPRKIIEKDPNLPKIIRTVRGVGYQFDL